MSAPFPTPPPIVGTADRAAQSCAASWEAVAGIGDLLMAGRLLDAWAVVTGAGGACWSSLWAFLTGVLPFLA